MQIVVNIDEDRYKSICDSVEAEIRVNMPSLYAHKIIANGTPLPKGHGRLIDADAYIDNYAGMGLLDAIRVVDFIKITPAIIEADRSVEE